MSGVLTAVTLYLQVEFEKPVDAKGNIEVWLQRLVDGMQDTVKQVHPTVPCSWLMSVYCMVDVVYALTSPVDSRPVA